MDVSHTLWKVPDILDWLKTTVSAFVKSARSESVDKEIVSNEQISLNLARMLYLTDKPEWLARLGTRGTIMQHDPFPPPDVVPSIYDQVSQQGRISSSASAMQAFLQSLLPFMQAPVENGATLNQDEAANQGIMDQLMQLVNVGMAGIGGRNEMENQVNDEPNDQVNDQMDAQDEEQDEDLEEVEEPQD